MARQTELSLMSCTYSALIFFKHPSFQEEREYRSVYYATPDNVAKTRFINSGGTMKPFRVLLEGSTAYHRLPIVEVIAGAARDEQAVRSAELMLASSGYDGVRVSLSRIPLSL